MTFRQLVFISLFAGLSLQAGTLNNVAADPTLGGNLTFTESGVVTTAYVGVIDATYNGTSVSPLFCVDLFTDIFPGGPYTSSPVLPRYWRNETRAAWLYANELSTVTDLAHAEAFQLAIWDIIHDNGDGPTAGKVESAAATPANVSLYWQQYLTVSQNQTSNQATIYVNYNSDTTPAQNLIGAFQSYAMTSVPEPSSLSFAGMGFAFLAGSQLLRRRKQNGMK